MRFLRRQVIPTECRWRMTGFCWGAFFIGTVRSVRYEEVRP